MLRVLEERPCRERPAEARLAALTVAERYARSPGALFRALFARACDGDTLLERDAEAAKTRAAELSELLEPDATPERLREVRDELRARLAAVRIGGDLERVEELERALRELDDRIGPAPRPPTPVPRAASPPPPTGPPVPLDELADLAAQIAARLRTEAER